MGFYRLKRLLAVNVDSNNASGVEESTMTTMPSSSNLLVPNWLP
jgi:hypothetical protein